MSTLGALRVLELTVHVPPSGAWFGSCVLDASELPALGATALTIGDLVLVGAVIRADFDDHPGGGRVVATVRGGAGWRLPVARAGSYASSGGVRLATVLRDLAAMAGEAYEAPADVSLGTAYHWQAHTPLGLVHGEHVLAELVTRGALSTWRVEPFTGRTVFNAWPSVGPADGRGRVVDRSGERGRRTVGLDVQVSAFLPGATLEGITIARTVLHEEAGSLRAHVFEDAAIHTPKRSIQSVILSLFPWLSGVVSVVGDKGKGLAIRTASGILHLAGGPADKGVVRGGDRGKGGTFALGVVPGSITYTGPDGTLWAFTFTCASPGAPVAIVHTPVVGDLGAVVIENVECSNKVTCA